MSRLDFLNDRCRHRPEPPRLRKCLLVVAQRMPLGNGIRDDLGRGRSHQSKGCVTNRLSCKSARKRRQILRVLTLFSSFINDIRPERPALRTCSNPGWRTEFRLTLADIDMPRSGFTLTINRRECRWHAAWARRGEWPGRNGAFQSHEVIRSNSVNGHAGATGDLRGKQRKGVVHDCNVQFSVPSPRG